MHFRWEGGDQMIIRAILIAAALALLVMAGQAQTGTGARPTGCHLKAGPDGTAALSVDIRVGADASLRTGDPLKIAWNVTLPMDSKCRSPLYLLFSTSDAVRFEGDGFFALPPGSEGPFGIAHRRERTRIFVPLHLGAEVEAGSLNVLIYQAGEFDIDWAIVEVPKVRLEGTTLADFATRSPIILTSDRNRTVLTIRTGPPRIVIQDRFPTRTPTAVIVAASGEYELHAYDGYFQVIERRTGALVLDRDGWHPNFSPTGRFVAAFRGRDAKSASRIEILDVISREMIVQGQLRNAGDVAVAWARRDAFVVVAKGEWGDIEVHHTLLRNRGFVTESLASGRFNSGTNSSVRLDIENALIEFCCENIGINGQSARSLALADRITPDEKDQDPTDEEYEKAQQKAEAQVRALLSSHALLKRPELAAHANLTRRWDLGEKLAFTHLQENTESGTLPEVRKLLLAKSRPITVTGDTKAPLRGRAISTRAANPTTTTTSVTSFSRNAVRELREYGIEMITMRSGLIFDEAATLKKSKSEKFNRNPLFNTIDTAGDHLFPEKLALKKAFLAEVPDARAHFLDDETNADYNCHDEVFKDAELTSIAHLSQAWQLTVHQRPIRIFYTICYTGATASGPPIARLFLFGQLSADDHWSFVNLGTLLPQEFTHVPQGEFDRSPLGVALANEHQLMLWSAPAGQIAIVDVAERKVTSMIKGALEANNIDEVRLSTDGSLIVQSNKSGRFFVYHSRTGLKLLNGYGLDDELVIYTDQGYFASSPEGAHLVSLSFPGLRGLHSFHQFKRVLYRPDLIRSIAGQGGAPIASPTISPPPAVEIALLKSASQTRTLKVSAQSAAGLSLVRIYRDGMLVRELPASGSQADVSVELDVPPRTRFITAVTIDNAGIESLPQSIELPTVQAGAMSRSTLYILAVGTDRYADRELLPLKYAKADARTFIKAASAAGQRSYGTVRTESLLDQPDLKNVLLDRIGKIAERTGPDDTIMLLAAGHGLLDDKGRFFLATTETQLSNLAGTAIASDEIAAALQRTKARVIIFLDACHSGVADGLGTNEDAAAAFLDRKSSMVVIAASKGRQYSQESAVIAGGLFTKAIEAALMTNRSRVDTNRNGTIELSELYGAVKRHVVEATAGDQTPWIARNNMIGEIPLF